MSKLFLIKHPELFQGENFLKNNKEYFEGWYFKNTKNNYSVSFIPGINVDGGKAKAFIQCITNNDTYFVDYDIKDFSFRHKPFEIRIGNNIFSKNKIHLDIQDKELSINGEILYSEGTGIKKSIMNPNIMGPFSYIPNMECNHAILCMKNKTKGCVKINKKTINLDNGTGYIEKDWGYSFPNSYVWIQGNNFENMSASFMLSIAMIPIKFIKFRGLICAFKIEEKEYKFTTYNNSKIVKYDIDNNAINIELKKGDYCLNVKAKLKTGLKLSAPIKGKMERAVYESVTSKITVTLKRKDRIIFSETSKNCGVEIGRKYR